MNTNSQKIHISNLQFFMTFMVVTIAYGHFVYIRLVYLTAGRDAWVCVGLGFFIATAVIYVQLKHAASHPQQSLIEAALSLFGKWIGGVVSVVYILFFILVSALTINELSSFLGLIYPKTPAGIFLVALYLFAAWVIRLGTEVVIRLAQLVLPGLMILGLTAAVITIPEKNPTRLLPILDHGFPSIWHGALMFIVMFADLVVFGMFAQNVDEVHKTPKYGLILIGILLLAFLGPATGPIMIFGESLTQALAYPTYSEIQFIQLSGLFERLDVLGVLLWTIGSVMRVTVFLLGATKGVANLLGAPKEQTYVLPTVLLASGVALSISPLSREETHQFLFSTYPLIACFVGIVLPLFTLLFSVFRSRLKKS